MLARSKSIFHLGEEGDEVARELDNSMRPPENLVGLRILIGEPKQASNVVIKHALKSSAATAFSPQIPGVSSHLGFLKSCQLCKRELSPQKDVFMYRGDQGFCSDECRARQIMFDESKEFEASTREHLGVPRHHPTPTIVGDLDQMRNISLVA